jgi:hypothetical protein
MQPANDNIGPDIPIRLGDIIQMAFPYGGMSVSGLRKEAGKGRLTIMRIAGKDFTTLSALEEMKEKCRVPVKQLASGYDQQARTGRLSTSSSTGEGSMALAAANLLVKKLSKS